ncbi:hypothetical protein SAMN05661093_06799 [Kibdelosporangium aridum]|uniref:Uncharacterized protein n=1 Tax=Kibdelosporangium aridum TaxID=2030 RepID=A0A1Y5XZU4_KIBAR|nr:hypothetical protein SAMN05661093_06799 [Kibdelosporangium aridum]
MVVVVVGLGVVLLWPPRLSLPSAVPRAFIVASTPDTMLTLSWALGEPLVTGRGRAELGR